MKGKKKKAAGKKRKYMTSLYGDRMVSKTHGRIVFRGIIDTLQAEVIDAQVLASELGEEEVRRSLGEILDCLRTIMAAEVKETPLPPPVLFGMDAKELRRVSHDTQGGSGIILPSYTQGPLAARLNILRARVREAELRAVKILGRREDIILALNRLSSALWWLFKTRHPAAATGDPQ